MARRTRDVMTVRLKVDQYEILHICNASISSADMNTV